jgi:hypothetical protein
MHWRVRYLANIIMTMNEDGTFTPRETLVLSELRNELSLTLLETADAVIYAVDQRQPLIHQNLITNEKNLIDMLVGVLVESTHPSPIVDLFVDQAAIPTHRVAALLDDARVRLAQLQRRVSTRVEMKR